MGVDVGVEVGVEVGAAVFSDGACGDAKIAGELGTPVSADWLQLVTGPTTAMTRAIAGGYFPILRVHVMSTSPL